MNVPVFGWSPLALGIQIAGTAAGTAVGTAKAVAKATTAGVQIAAAPRTRRCSVGNGRAWIEVRGLDGPDGVGAAVLDAVRGLPGVTAASLNRPLSRVVVEFDAERMALDELCSAVDGAQRAGLARQAGTRSLPGDGMLLTARAAMVGVEAVALAVALTGRALRLPRAPIAVDAAVAFANYQPWLRRRLEDRIGTGAADTALSLAATAAHVVTLSPVTLGVNLTMQALRVAESHAAARAWHRHEPRLAGHAGESGVYPPSRPVPPPEGPTERQAKRAAYLQAIGAGLVGVITRNPATAAEMALVTAPKALRTTGESFAATLGRGLADRHDVLTLRPESLRRLDKVDALLIDPRVLCDDKLRVVHVRGADHSRLAAAWAKAQSLLDKPGLKPGWHRVPRMNTASGADAVEALIAPVHHPLASVLAVEARAAGVELVCADSPADAGVLGELAAAFDDVRPVRAGALDEALGETLEDLQRDGRTVAVLSARATRALAGADVALGVMPAGGGVAPPFQADLIAADLAGAWQVLHALPAARQASQRGITLSASASALGAVLMVPGARSRRGRGPGPVTAGAVAGLLSGYLLARRAVQAAAPRPAPAYEWHAMPVERVREVLAGPGFATEPHRVDPRRPSGVWQFVRAVRAELADPLTPIMAVGSAATALLGSPIDAVMVGTVLAGNAMLAAAQQLRAESKLNVLLAQQTPPARTVTTGPDGQPAYREIAAERLRPGDVVEVRSNEVVPADARVIEEADLEVDESSLTGESLSVGKQVEATPGAELADRRCMLYAGTTVVAGTAVALVTAAGADTQTRRAAELASGEPPAVGLQYQLSKLMYRAFPVSAAGGALVGVLGLVRGGGPARLRQALGDAIAVGVAAVPEGMPLMATLAQYASARRLSGSGALVRVPRSVEALGRIDVVCFDKTGTLSENRLRVTRVRPVAGCAPDEVLRCAADAAPTGGATLHAHATDQAIVEAAAQAGIPAAPEPDAHLPFRSGRAFSAAARGAELTVKGAPEVVLAACENSGGASDFSDTVAELAAGGLRVIAVARRRLTAQQARSVAKDPDRIAGLCGAGLALTGFLGLADTARAEAPQLLADLADRGVDIRLITGDHPVTATAIAADLGMPVTADHVITGSEWNALSRKGQERAVGERVVFARMSPEHKVQIVQTLERAGRICAMVGDGANDAAAIRAATVGIGVVARGSDSAHTVADVVLTDGRIGALVGAVDEGRRLWRGVQEAVTGLLGGNLGEVIFSVIGSAVTGNSPLNTRQLLLMNALTDALPATAVAVSTPSGPVQRVGRGLDEDRLWRAVATRGVITATAATGAWVMAGLTPLPGRPQRASTVALIALVSVELGQTLTDSHAPLVLLTAAGSFAAFAAMVSMPGVSQLLGCTPVGPLGWAQALGPAAVATLAVAGAARATRLPARGGSNPASAPAPAERRPATAARTTRAKAGPAGARRLKLVDPAEPVAQKSST